MHALSILLLVLIGGTFIVSTACMPFSPEHRKGRRWWMLTAASCLMVIGAAGFFGSGLSAAGALNWLPTFEWPVGYTGGVVSTADGLHVVPHTPSGRIQVYDADWTFVTGWHVDANGGTFKLLAPAENRIEAITARGRWHYVFAMDGTLISKNCYEPRSYDSFPSEGQSMVVPTAPWLWTFSHPGISWAVLAVGMVMLIIMQKAGKRKAAGRPGA